MQVYNQTDQYLHWLCQPIAKAGRSFVLPQPDDSHTNLYFDALGERLIGHWINLGTQKVMLTLKLLTLEFEWVNDKFQVIATCSAVGKTMDELEDSLAAQAQGWGLNTAEYKTAMNYEMPDYAFAKKPIKALAQEAVKHWMYYRRLANDTCTWVLGYGQTSGEVRVWPHHFDTGIFVYPVENLGIGFGWAMSDKLHNEPYFYMSGYPAQGTLDYTQVPTLENGKWCVNDEWSGATLPYATLETLKASGDVQVINDFLRKSFDWFLENEA